MSAWAAPGVKCVCVGDLTHLGVDFGVNTPVVGGTYTVRDAEFRLGPDGGFGLLLVEVINAPQPLTSGRIGEISFDVCDFRPLVADTEEQNLEIFRPILTNTSVEEDA